MSIQRSRHVSGFLKVAAGWSLISGSDGTGNVWSSYRSRREGDRKERANPIEWNGPDNPSLVEWTFEAKGENTLVIVKSWGFGGNTQEIMAQAIASTSGFTFLLAGLKVFLEHGIEPNFVVDHDPDSLVQKWASSQAA